MYIDFFFKYHVNGSLPSVMILYYKYITAYYIEELWTAYNTYWILRKFQIRYT